MRARIGEIDMETVGAGARVMTEAEADLLVSAALREPISNVLIPEQLEEAVRSRIPAKRWTLASRNIAVNALLVHLVPDDTVRGVQLAHWQFAATDFRRRPCLRLLPGMTRVLRRIDVARTALAQLDLFS